MLILQNKEHPIRKHGITIGTILRHGGVGTVIEVIGYGDCRTVWGDNRSIVPSVSLCRLDCPNAYILMKVKTIRIGNSGSHSNNNGYMDSGYWCVGTTRTIPPGAGWEKYAEQKESKGE